MVCLGAGIYNTT